MLGQVLEFKHQPSRFQVGLTYEIGLLAPSPIDTAACPEGPPVYPHNLAAGSGTRTASFHPSSFTLHTSFVPQRDHGIDFACPPRGDVTRQERHSNQNERDGDEREWVGGLDAVEQAG
jgi:hypothetical protein